MSRRASQAGIEAIRNAIKRNGWKQTELAKECGFARSTLNQILSGQPVRLENLAELCHLLDLEVGQILEPETPANESSLDNLVQTVRDQIRPLIQERCGTMRVLDMSQPIELGEIYTHVNILEKISSRTRRDIAELMQDMAPETFERFGRGRIKESGIPGLEAVEKYPKLMILGKPGAGKTTFLKHLAIECSGGTFQAHRVPLFITLKEFAETEGQPDLITFMESLTCRGAQGLTATTSPTTTIIPTILENGHALILLDGLDEVRETDASRVLRQIQRLADRYAGNAFIITCRIAAREYTFQQFTDVEVADFDDAQIADVSGKWFRCKQDEVKAERFLEKLKANSRIRDLASSPLLLTLLCLVFEESGDFPANRAELYQEGVDILLKKWDAKRNIERDQIYKKLSLKRKEDLLSQIAWRTFAAGNYFFKQTDVERYIHEFIEHLPGSSADEDTLNLDSTAVLNSIEAQHGLLVKRAHRIYSFSHLTFHEYFTSRQIICTPTYYRDVLKYITKKTWREVFILTTEMLPEADSFILAFKDKIDHLLEEDEESQNFLNWFNRYLSENEIFCEDVKARLFYLEAISTTFKEVSCDSLIHEKLAWHKFDDVIDSVTGAATERALNLIGEFGIDFDQSSELINNLAVNLALDLIFSHLILSREKFAESFQLNFLEILDFYFHFIGNKTAEILYRLEEELDREILNLDALTRIIRKVFAKRFMEAKDDEFYSYCTPDVAHFLNKLSFENLLDEDLIKSALKYYATYDWESIGEELRINIGKTVNSLLKIESEKENFNFDSDLSFNHISEFLMYSYSDIDLLLSDLFVDEETWSDVYVQYEDLSEVSLEQWWEIHGKKWMNSVRTSMIDDCNLGYGWKLSEEQQSCFDQYLYANKLLIDCLNSDCYVSRAVRQEIEDTLLLPLSELEQRPSSQPSA